MPSTKSPASMTERAPTRRESHAVGTAATASTRLNATSTQATRAIEVENSPSTFGRASTTIEESASTTPTARAKPPRRRVRTRRPGRGPARETAEGAVSRESTPMR